MQSIRKTPPLGGKGRRHGDPTVVSILSQDATSITFDVEHTAASDQDNPYLVWVACIIRGADGVDASHEYLPVQWDDPTAPNPTHGTAGPFSLTSENPDVPPPYSGVAFAWVFPDAWTPISNTVPFTV